MSSKSLHIGNYCMSKSLKWSAKPSICLPSSSQIGCVNLCSLRYIRKDLSPWALEQNMQHFYTVSFVSLGEEKFLEPLQAEGQVSHYVMKLLSYLIFQDYQQVWSIPRQGTPLLGSSSHLRTEHGLTLQPGFWAEASWETAHIYRGPGLELFALGLDTFLPRGWLCTKPRRAWLN